MTPAVSTDYPVWTDQDGVGIPARNPDTSLSRSWANSRPAMRRIMFRAGIYIGWVGFLNLGDEAMYQLCRKRYPSIRWTLSSTLAYSPRTGQFARRGNGDLRQILESVWEELHDQRRLRALATQTLHRLARRSGGEVGICGGGTYLNRSAEALRTYTEIRKRSADFRHRRCTSRILAVTRDWVD